MRPDLQPVVNTPARGVATRVARSVTIALAIAVFAAGCGATRPKASEPGVAGMSSTGLRISEWTLDDRTARGGEQPGSFDAFVATLDRFAEEPLPFGPEVSVAWKREGLRAVAVPVAEAELLRARLRAAGPLQQRFFGELLGWTAVHTGAESEFPMVVEQPGGALRLNAGELRLLARAFVVPGGVGEAGDRLAMMRVDLAVQHFDPAARRPASIDMTPERSLPVEEEGPILRSLSAEGVWDGSRALVIIPDSTPRAGTSAEDLPAGPMPPVLPRVGDALLTDFSSLPRPRVRTVILLEAVVPKSYQLTPF